MDILEQKKALRKKQFGVRAAIDQEQKKAFDNRVNEGLQQLIAERKAKVVHVYIPMGTEIDIRPTINWLLKQDMVVVSPKTLPKRKLENRVLQSLQQLETGIMGTQHPAEAKVYTGPIDFVIVPGLAYDVNRYRLGYGGGYYDNFLMEHPKAFKVGIFYPEQRVDIVPREAHDVQLDLILFEK